MCVPSAYTCVYTAHVRTPSPLTGHPRAGISEEEGRDSPKVTRLVWDGAQPPKPVLFTPALHSCSRGQCTGGGVAGQPVPPSMLRACGCRPLAVWKQDGASGKVAEAVHSPRPCWLRTVEFCGWLRFPRNPCVPPRAYAQHSGKAPGQPTAPWGGRD